MYKYKIMKYKIMTYETIKLHKNQN